MTRESKGVSLNQIEMLPVAIKYLLYVNAAFFFLTVAAHGLYEINLVDYFGLHQPDSAKFQPHQFLTHIFMHGGGLHLFLNMFILWMFGSVLESIWGAKKFLFYFFFTGLGAAMLHVGVQDIQLNRLENAVKTYQKAPSFDNFKSFREDHMGRLPNHLKEEVESLQEQWAKAPQKPTYKTKSRQVVREYWNLYRNMPTVGASGAVYGVLLAFGMLFPNVYIYLYLLVPIKAKYFVIFITLMELYLGFFNTTSNVANFAHIGGMIFGYILLKIWGSQPMDLIREQKA